MAMSQATTLKRKHPLAECENCPLASRGCAPSQIPTGKARAAIVSRSPGHHDVMSGKPFGGPSGKVLDHLLKMNGVSRDEVLITNVVLCSPPEGKVPPEAIKACSKRLRYELRDINLIIAAGSEAVGELIGRGTIEYYRGYRIDRGRQTYVATNNPALVLRDDSTYPNLVKDFQRAFHPRPKPQMPKVQLIEDEKTARSWFREHEAYAGYLTADIESRGGLTHKATLVSIQFSFDGTSAIVFGERGKLFKSEGFITDCLRPWFESRERQFIWHNGIFDTKILRHSYAIQARVDEDTLLLSYALDERSGAGLHELEYLLMEELGWPYYTPASVNSFKKTGKLVSDKEQKALAKQFGEAYERAYKELENKNYIALYKYGGYDAAGDMQLFQLLAERAKEEGVWQKPYKETLLAAEEVLHSMETTGIPYDYNHAAEILEMEIYPELSGITEKLRKLTGKELLKPSSPTQMAAYYYDDHHIMHDMRNRPDKNRSVDESARKEIIDGRFAYKGSAAYEIVDGVVAKKEVDNNLRDTLQAVAREHDRFQKLNKQAGTYLLSLIERAEADPESRIYTTLPRHATSTGRLASRGPNLQNITRTKEGLPDIRDLFYAPDGFYIVQADYSQAELRTIAALSGDPLLSGVYERGEDLHNLTATRFYGEGFTPEQRSNSKNMNFGVFYRQSADTFLEKHEIPVEEAQEYIEWVWKTFTRVGEWEKEIEKLVHTNAYRNYTYVESPFGHRRRFYLITNENRNASYREAINFLPQNIAANLTLHACIRLHEDTRHLPAALCLTVHDSIIAIVHESAIDEYKQTCIKIMESRPREILGWKLPFKADVGVGKTWATAK